MDDESCPLDDLAEDVLEGRPVDWKSAARSPDRELRAAVQQLRVLAGIAGMHRSLASEAAEPLEHWGRLKILAKIGQGSFGDVYRAWDTKLDREVALKLLRSDAAPQRGAEVLKEARLLARVRHPNVAIVYDADEIDGRVGLWMEFIHGKNLEETLGEKKKLDEREVTRIGIDLCRALAAVHEAGLLHRDIKAQNVMRQDDGRLVLMDFGTGSDSESSSGATDAAGTPLYLAPEIFEGSPATVQGDIYSVGVLLFHLLTGAYPVKGSTLESIAEAHAKRVRATKASSASGPLSSVIARAIEREPSKRHASAKEMASALDATHRRAQAPRYAFLIAAGFSMAILLVAATAWLSRPESRPVAAPLSFKARDWVLVSDFDNRTGDKLFDGTLDFALGLELANSRYVNVVSRDRVKDTLKLMEKPTDTRIDAATGREVCLRDGGIRALLTGRIERLGARNVVSAELVNPSDGSTLARFHEDSGDADGSLNAVRRISDRVRAALGEAPQPGETARLAKVTTSSLKALQLYSRADEMMSEASSLGPKSAKDAQSAAEQLLRQAVAEDPTFASAWIHLAFTLLNQNKSRAEAQACAEKAVALADAITDRERYFIRGSYYAMTRQLDKAINAYETLLALYPDHFWAANNVISLCDYSRNRAELEKALRLETQLADSRPRDFSRNREATYDYLMVTGDSIRALRYAQRASEAITPEIREHNGDGVASLDLVPSTAHWLAGDIATAAGEVDRIALKIESSSGDLRDAYASNVATAYMTLGQLEAAKKAAEKIADPVLQNATLIEVCFFAGDWAQLRRRLQRQERLQPEPDAFGTWSTTLVFQAREGLASIVETFKRNPNAFSEPIRPGVVSGIDIHTVEGELRLSQGRTAAALTALEKAKALYDSRIIDFPPSFFLGRESLASIYAGRGQMTAAIQVLERLPHRLDAFGNGSTPNAGYWLRNRLQLAKLYRRAGRTEEARPVEKELRELLAVADADHPILVELQRLPA